MQQIAIIDASRAALYIIPMPTREWLNSKMGHHDIDEDIALQEWIEEQCNADLSNSNWQVVEQTIYLSAGAVPLANVENMTSPRGSEVPNQFIIRTEQGTYFKSYRSIIAFIPRNGGKTVLDESKWDYSTTTGKYRNQFLGEDINETRRKIKDGTYILADLNG